MSQEGQSEISEATQTKESYALAEEKGYNVPDEYILGTEWHSLSVWDSPAFQRVRELVSTGEVGAVFMYDPDRGPSKPVHRLLFRELCEEAGVKVFCRHGQIPEGEMADVMEMLSAHTKQMQVLRAQRGARDGLRDRAMVKQMPISTRPIYGYQWNGQQFEPDSETFRFAQRIWTQALEGVPMRKIARALMNDGVRAPGGGTYWHPSSIAGMLSNPVYRGQYMALRTRAVTPKQRRRGTYGKTSTVRRAEAEQVVIPGLVSQPMVSTEEFSQVKERLSRNKAEGGREVQPYLLRGRIRCELCGRLYRGKANKTNTSTYYYYVCRGSEDRGMSRCKSKAVNGPLFESRLIGEVEGFITKPEVLLSAKAKTIEGKPDMIAEAQATIKRLEKELSKLASAEAMAYSGWARGKTSEETYSTVASEIEADRQHLSDELDRQRAGLLSLQSESVGPEAVRRLHPQIVERIRSASFEDRRFVLDCLDTEVTIGPSGVKLSLAVPEESLASVYSGPRSG